MKYNRLITEYYESDKEYPIKIVDIEPYPGYGENFYEVFCKDDEGEFTNIVYIQNYMVIVVPE